MCQCMYGSANASYRHAACNEYKHNVTRAPVPNRLPVIAGTQHVSHGYSQNVSAVSMSLPAYAA